LRFLRGAPAGGGQLMADGLELLQGARPVHSKPCSSIDSAWPGATIR
jgi:hypothetical protein